MTQNNGHHQYDDYSEKYDEGEQELVQQKFHRYECTVTGVHYDFANQIVDLTVDIAGVRYEFHAVAPLAEFIHYVVVPDPTVVYVIYTYPDALYLIRIIARKLR